MISVLAVHKGAASSQFVIFGSAPREVIMIEANHQEYYVARAAASRKLEQRAINPAIAAIHAELALRYDQLACEPC